MSKEKCRILVVSDSHGGREQILAAIEKEQPFDRLIHCGDIERSAESVFGPEPGYPVTLVRGNCDASDYPAQVLVEEAGHRILVVHGNRFGVHAGLDTLITEAGKQAADIVCFGHTHEPLSCFRNGILLLNPGSIARPRQSPRRKTYAVLYLEKDKLPRGDIFCL